MLLAWHRAAGTALNRDTTLMHLYLVTHAKKIALKNKLPTDQDGYAGSETTVRKFSARRIQWVCIVLCIPLFKKLQKTTSELFDHNIIYRFITCIFMRQFQWWSRNVNHYFGSLATCFFVWSNRTSNPAVEPVYNHTHMCFGPEQQQYLSVPLQNKDWLDSKLWGCSRKFIHDSHPGLHKPS